MTQPYTSPSPVNDAGDSLGTIHTREEKRDAIHLAVSPVSCAVALKPGDHIYYIGNDLVEKADKGKGHGIVDPFLLNTIKPGEKFWFVMYPRQIRSLRHVWTHPAFDQEKEEVVLHVKPFLEMGPEERRAAALIGHPEATAHQAIQQIADDLDVDPDELMERANAFLSTGSYWIDEDDGGKFEGESVSQNYWEHHKVLFPDADVSNAHSFLSCSC